MKLELLTHKRDKHRKPTKPTTAGKKSMSSLIILALPDHIVFYYRLAGGETLATGFPLDIQLLSIRLTGRFLAAVDDPQSVARPSERIFELDAPCVGRGGHPQLKTTITATSPGSVICFVPKTELLKIVTLKKARKWSAVAPYSVISNLTPRN
jgi:hypothetical protein